MTKTLGVLGLGHLLPLRAALATAAPVVATGPSSAAGSPAPRAKAGSARTDRLAFFQGLTLVEAFSITPYGLV